MNTDNIKSDDQKQKSLKLIPSAEAPKKKNKDKEEK